MLRALEEAEAGGYRVEAIYRREPNITVEQAAPIAEREFVKVKAEHPDILFDPLEFWPADRLCCWVFHATIPGQYVEGGGLYINIDKQDGHVWQIVEFARLHEEEFFIILGKRQKATLLVDNVDRAHAQNYQPDLTLAFPSGRICDLQEFEELPCEERRAISIDTEAYKS